EEHMLRTAEADSLAAEVDRGAAIERSFGVGPDLQAPNAVGPGHELGEVACKLGLHRGNFAEHHLAGSTIEGDDIAFPQLNITRPQQTRSIIDSQLSRACDASAPHAAGHHSGMARHAATSGENPLGGMHAVDVLGAGLDTAEDDFPPLLCRCFRLVSREYDLTRRGTGRG